MSSERVIFRDSCATRKPKQCHACSYDGKQGVVIVGAQREYVIDFGDGSSTFAYHSELEYSHE